MATPRVNGFLGAVGSPDLTVAQYAPTLDADWGLSHASLDFGSASGWTLYLVWTRPNLRQGTIQVNGNPIPLVHSVPAAATLLQADSAVPGSLTLFPSTKSAIKLTGSLERRHSHAIILTHAPGSGVSAWLDGTLVASASPIHCRRRRPDRRCCCMMAAFRARPNAGFTKRPGGPIRLPPPISRH